MATAASTQRAVFMAAIEFHQAREHQRVTKKSIGEHRSEALSLGGHSDEHWCEKGGVPSDHSGLDLNLTPECFRTKQPEAEWCGWCREHGRLWKARQRAARGAGAALTKLQRACQRALDLNAL